MIEIVLTANLVCLLIFMHKGRVQDNLISSLALNPAYFTSEV